MSSQRIRGVSINFICYATALLQHHKIVLELHQKYSMDFCQKQTLISDLTLVCCVVYSSTLGPVGN